MSGESLRDKQKRIRIEGSTAISSDEISHSDHEKKQENGHLDDANREWRRFYEVVKEITINMRY